MCLSDVIAASYVENFEKKMNVFVFFNVCRLFQHWSQEIYDKKRARLALEAQIYQDGKK